MEGWDRAMRAPPEYSLAHLTHFFFLSRIRLHDFQHAVETNEDAMRASKGCAVGARDRKGVSTSIWRRRSRQRSGRKGCSRGTPIRGCRRGELQVG